MRRTIKSKQEITRLFKEGRRVQTASMLAIVSKQDAAEFPSGRIAVIAGKRLGTAPQRSRAKRLIREAARLSGAPWEGYEVALVAKERLLRSGWASAQKDMGRIANQLVHVERR